MSHMEDEGPYKVVELTTVTDESLEETLNHWDAQGYEAGLGLRNGDSQYQSRPEVPGSHRVFRRSIAFSRICRRSSGDSCLHF